MKNNGIEPVKVSGIIILCLVFILSVLWSCEKDKEQTEYESLVSYQKLKTIRVADAKLLMGYINLPGIDVQRVIDNTLYDVDVYKLVYKVIFKGSEIKASGIVCLPNSSQSFPVLSFQNGTNTAKLRAPTSDIFSLQYTLLQGLSGNGYIILMADYLGFGESQQLLHPYYHRESNDSVVLGLVAACDEFLAFGNVQASGNDQLFLMGYSQGGWATLSALSALENNMPAGKEIMAVSCGAGAYNVTEVAKYIFQLDDYPAPFYLPYFIESHIRNGFLEGPIQKYFNEPYAGMIPGLFDGVRDGGSINGQLTDSVQLLLNPDMIENLETGAAYEGLRDEMELNSVGAWPSASKILFFHGRADDNVPSFESLNIYDAFINKGVSPSQLQLVMEDTLKHETGLIPWGIKTILWFNDIKLQN
ncbi:MAG: lipase family protein [Bacteroidales bacterium]